MQPNPLEKIMYKATAKKLRELGAERIRKEQSVELSPGCFGSYDFVADIHGFRIGLEILCRPTKGKLMEKLRYAEHVDKYIFVLPSGAMGLYRRPHTKSFGPLPRPKFLPKAFRNKKLYVWLCDLGTKSIVAQAPFTRVFNVEE